MRVKGRKVRVVWSGWHWRTHWDFFYHDEGFSVFLGPVGVYVKWRGTVI